MSTYTTYFIILLMAALLLQADLLCAQVSDEEIDDTQLMEMSLAELLAIEIVTASNNKETLDKSPASVLVITEQEIRERGYFKLYDVLNDLPGFDLSRAFGDDQYYAYVRGYRKTTSDQMLLMIDGIIMNHLYNNNMNAYIQYPLQSIKQIEIVYGPASAIYGPNAFSGVINMITKKGSGSLVQVTAGQNNTNIIDLHVSENVNDLTINLTGRLYQSDGPDLEGRTPLLEDTLFTNPYYWGDFAQTQFTGYNSPIKTNFLHTSLDFKGLSVGFINFFYESGLGTEFAGGTSLNAGTWQNKENTFYAKYEKSMGKLSSKTLLKYRRSDIPGSSTFLWRWLTQGVDTVMLAPGASYTPNPSESDTYTNNSSATNTYVVDRNYQYAEYWQANNASFSFYQNFTYDASDALAINFGLKFKSRTLNRNYIINTTEVPRDYLYTLADVNRASPLNPPVLSAIDFPARPDDASLDQENHNTLTDQGAYVQVQYSPVSAISIFGGIRYDYNSVWKEVWSPRIGIVAEAAEGLIVKAFFGTAFLEPSARILYGGWSGSLSNDKLVPEKMRTTEVSANYVKDNFSLGLNVFFNSAPDAIGQGSGKVPINLGKRRMMGSELSAKYQVRNQGNFLSKFRGDLYVSYIKSEEDLADTGDFINTGNMAPVKVKLILTGYLKDRFSISLQNRYISEIETVASNPLGTIDAYFVNDLFIQYEGLLVEGLSLGLKVYNLFNTKYDHPGYRAADAGETTVNHALLNTSWYNSRLPQPSTNVLFNLRYQF